MQQPIDCDIGVDCHVQQTVDHDPTDGASDFRCGSLTYDGHKGTDFGLASLSAQAAGVDVIAAAPGVVAGVRDSMPDRLQDASGAPTNVSGVECGNGVLIRHDDGWETQYCHMAQGSVRVANGDLVQAGAPLGRVGLSGQTQFPHLHLSVRKDGQMVDPFDPDGTITCGTPSQDTLWADPVAAPPGGMLTAGFSAVVPEYQAIKAGTVSQDLQRGAALVLWGFYYGSRAGDILRMTITGPQGQVFADAQTLDRTQAQAFRAGGKRAPAGGWPTGDYSGRIDLFRDGQLLDRISATGRID